MTMYRFLVLATALMASLMSVESFAPIPKMLNLVRSFQQMQNSMLLVSKDPTAAKSDPNPKFPTSSNKKETSEDDAAASPPAAATKSETSPIDEMKDKLVAVMDQDKANQILGNMLSGEFGKRGEAYVATQVFLVLCILFGGLPVLGDALNFICGPILIALGAGVCALGIIDMGASLSPWPVPTGDDLITEGIYSKMRHPIYSGLLAIMAGFSIVTGSAPRLLLTAALWYALDLKSDYEEKQLVEEFDEYEAYREQVPGKFFPQEIVAILPWTDSGDEFK